MKKLVVFFLLCCSASVASAQVTYSAPPDINGSTSTFYLSIGPNPTQSTWTLPPYCSLLHFDAYEANPVGGSLEFGPSDVACGIPISINFAPGPATATVYVTNESSCPCPPGVANPWNPDSTYNLVRNSYNMNMISSRYFSYPRVINRTYFLKASIPSALSWTWLEKNGVKYPARKAKRKILPSAKSTR